MSEELFSVAIINDGDPVKEITFADEQEADDYAELLEMVADIKISGKNLKQLRSTLETILEPDENPYLILKKDWEAPTHRFPEGTIGRSDYFARICGLNTEDFRDLLERGEMDEWFDLQSESEAKTLELSSSILKALDSRIEFYRNDDGSLSSFNENVCNSKILQELIRVKKGIK